MEALTSSIVSILVNLISNDLSDLSKKSVTKLRIRRIRRKINRWCTKYIISHDGTILTEGRFVHFLEFQNPLGEIYYYSQAPTAGVPEEEFLADMVKKAQRDIEGSLDVNDQIAIKHFYKDILKQIDEFWISLLSTSERTLLHCNAVNTAKVLTLVSEMGTDIKNSISNHFSSSQLSEKDALAIFHALNDRFWCGEFREIIDLYPVIEGKSNDLVLWLKLSLDIAMQQAPFVINPLEYQNIESHEMHDDIIRKILLFSMLKEDAEYIDTDVYENNLKVIAEKVKEGDFSVIYTQNIEKKNHTSLVGIRINESYVSEMWLVKRVLIMHLISQPFQGISDLMRNLLGDESDYLMDLIITRQMVEDKFQDNRDITHKVKEAFDTIWGRKNIYTDSCLCVQDIFWNLCISFYINSDKDKLRIVLSEIPENITSRAKIKDSIYMARIELGEVEYEELLVHCKQAGTYWLVNNYFVSLANPQKVVMLIDKDKQLLLGDAMIYFDYVRALHLLKEESKEKAILTEYKNKYSDFIEYWIHRIEVERSEDDVNKLEELWMSDKLRFFTPIAESTMAELFFKWKRFGSCIEVIGGLEARGIVSKHDKKLEVMSLNALGKKVEALGTLKAIFSEVEIDEFVVNNIILYSLDLKRTIDKAVLDAAKKINSAYSLILVAKVCERENRSDEAKNWYKRSLILNIDDNDIIYGNYWNFSIQGTSQAEMAISGADEETAVYVKNVESGIVEVYCICPRDYLPMDPYLWNNTIHISLDTAVRYGLLRKKTGDMLVLHGKDYEIIDIIPLECFYDRYCMTRMIEGGHAKACQVPMTDDREANVELFTKWLKDNISDDSSKNGVFQEYKNFSKLPLTLYSLNRFTRLAYGQFVICLFEDKDTIVREEYDFNKNHDLESKSGYVLSFSATVLLFMLGVNSDLIGKINAFIPKSLVVALKDEKEAIFKEYNRETVATMGLADGKLFVNQAGEEEKSKWMKYAVELVDYCEHLPQIDNENSISAEIITEDDVMQLYGVVDYDAISICRARNMVLVSIEQFLSSLSSIPEINIETINALELLQSIDISKEDLICYMTKMVSYRLINIINPGILFDIVNGNAEDSSPEMISAWEAFLLEIDKARGQYREILQCELTLSGKKVLEKDTFIGNPFMKVYSSLVMKLNSLKYTYWIADDGGLNFGIVHESYEDVEK